MSSNPAIALSIVVTVVAATILFALLCVRRLKMDPQQYIVGDRSFGTILIWVLLAGEIYTTFTFLGIAGWSYGMGAPAFYIIAYGTCAYAISYFLLPPIWRMAKERGLLTAPDFFEARYNSRLLGILIALFQFALVVPYVTLQLTGLQILLRIAGYGMYESTFSVVIAFIVLAVFVFTAGLRGTAWASVVKDTFVLGGVIFAGFVIPTHFFGSPAAMLHRFTQLHSAMLTLAPGTRFHGEVWYVSTVLLTAIGFFMGPHSMSAVYSARSEEVLRRNAVLLPLYQLFLVAMIFAGFCALLVVPGLKGTAIDQSFLLLVQRYYPPWVLGLIAAAGSLAALIPASALLLGAASVFSKNILSDAFGVAKSDASRTLATRILVVIVALLALGLWLKEQRTLVEILLLYYNGLSQLAPGVYAAVAWRRANAWGVGAGILTGLAIAVPLSITGATPFGVNAGFIAMLANAAVMVAVTLLTSRSQRCA